MRRGRRARRAGDLGVSTAARRRERDDGDPPISFTHGSRGYRSVAEAVTVHSTVLLLLARLLRGGLRERLLRDLDRLVEAVGVACEPRLGLLQERERGLGELRRE